MKSMNNINDCLYFQFKTEIWQKKSYFASLDIRPTVGHLTFRSQNYRDYHYDVCCGYGYV